MFRWSIAQQIPCNCLWQQIIEILSEIDEKYNQNQVLFPSRFSHTKNLGGGGGCAICCHKFHLSKRLTSVYFLSPSSSSISVLFKPPLKPGEPNELLIDSRGGRCVRAQLPARISNAAQMASSILLKVIIHFNAAAARPGELCLSPFFLSFSGHQRQKVPRVPLLTHNTLLCILHRAMKGRYAPLPHLQTEQRESGLCAGPSCTLLARYTVSGNNNGPTRSVSGSFLDSHKGLFFRVKSLQTSSFVQTHHLSLFSLSCSLRRFLHALKKTRHIHWYL